jgi:hypothetical protein
MNSEQTAHPYSDGFADDFSTDPGQDGEALRAGDSWREVRRVDRLRSVVVARDACTAAILRIERGLACRLPDREQSQFDVGGDPHLALTRVVTALGRMVVLEDRLDESAEQRTARLAAEAAEREKARLAEQAQLNRRRMEAVLEKKKAHIRRAVDLAQRHAAPDMRLIDRITRLDDLFGKFDDYGDWDDDPVKLVADLCIQLGLHAPLPKGSGPRPKNKAEQAARARAQMLKTAQCYLDWTADSAPAELDEPTAPPARSQGPPGQ